MDFKSIALLAVEACAFNRAAYAVSPSEVLVPLVAVNRAVFFKLLFVLAPLLLAFGNGGLTDSVRAGN